MMYLGNMGPLGMARSSKSSAMSVAACKAYQRVVISR
jgi:hypothetical protein